MSLGGGGTQAGAPWRASIARTGAEGGDTLPRADVGPGGGVVLDSACWGGQELYSGAASW